MVPRSSRILLTSALLACMLAIAPPALGALTVRFVSVTSPVSLGGPVRIEVVTVPGAVCDIEVRNGNGLVRAAGIRPKKADGQGRIVWLWRVSKKMAPGKWSVLVDCLLGHDLGRAETLFTVKHVK